MRTVCENMTISVATRLTIVLVLCACTGIVALAQKKSTPIEYPPEEHAVMAQFQQALRERQWGKALSLCSDRVRAYMAGYATPEAFFNAVVPVPQIVDMKSFPVWTYQTRGSRDITQPKPEQFVLLGHFVRLPRDKPEPEVSWEWKTYKPENRWIIDFDLKPLWEVIETETKRLTREAEDARRSRAVADHVITRAKTRLTALTKECVVGLPMLFRLELVNECDFDLAYDASRVAVTASLRVTDADGQPAPCTLGPVQTTTHYQRIKAGETAVLFDNLDLGKSYDLHKPGRYKVQFSGQALTVGIPEPKRPGPNYESPIHATSKPLPSNFVEIEFRAAPH